MTTTGGAGAAELTRIHIRFDKVVRISFAFEAIAFREGREHELADSSAHGRTVAVSDTIRRTAHASYSGM